MKEDVEMSKPNKYANKVGMVLTQGGYNVVPKLTNPLHISLCRLHMICTRLSIFQNSQ